MTSHSHSIRTLRRPTTIRPTPSARSGNLKGAPADRRSDPAQPPRSAARNLEPGAGRAYLLLGRWDQAIDANLRARAQQQGFINIHLALAAAYAQQGDRRAAKVSLADALALRSDLTLDWLRAHPFSNEPAYVTLANRTFYDGLRKAGLP